MKVSTWHNCYGAQWAGILLPASMSHPAKFSCGLIRRIIQYGFERGYWVKGSVVADPFGGVGTGGITAAYVGLNWIGCELEPRFVGMAKSNFALHLPTLKAHGFPVPRIVQGDSRRFHELIQEVGGICTSPPYAEGLGHSGDSPRFDAIASEKILPRPDYGTSEGQIGAMKTGDLDSVVSSPPYNLPFSQDHNGKRGGLRSVGETESSEAGAFHAYGSELGQIEGLPQGDLAAVVSSPPYVNQGVCERNGIDESKLGKHGPHSQVLAGGYGTSPGQLGAMPTGSLDAITTSPPFEDSLGTKDHEFEDRRQSARGRNINGAGHKGSMERYGEAQGQIGSEQAETYWSSMKAVFESCYIALKPGGVMVLVLKSYVKKGRIVNLPMQTLKLLVHLGFEPLERIKAMLVKESRTPGLFGEDVVTSKSRKSFFRRLHEKKNPGTKIDYETVLIVRKP